MAETATARRIVDERKARGWNQRQLAERAGVAVATVGKVERGEDVLPSRRRAITDALGLTRSDENDEQSHSETGPSRNVLPESWIVLDLPEDVLRGLTPAERDEVETEARRAALQAARERRDAAR